jgi:hypothetical protein
MHWLDFSGFDDTLERFAKEVFSRWAPVVNTYAEDGTVDVWFSDCQEVDTACELFPIEDDRLGGVGFNNCDVTDHGFRMALSVGGRTSLKEISLSKTHVTAAALDVLENCPNLREFTFDVSKSADIACEWIGRCCPKLEVLRLSNSAVNESDLHRLRRLESLREIILNDTEAGGDGNVLGSFPSLKRIECDTDHCSDSLLRGVPDLQFLESLSTSGRGMTDAGVRYLARHPSLTHLYLRRSGIADTSIQWISTIPNLVALTIDDASLLGTSLGALANCPKLVAVRLSRVTVNAEALRGLAHSPQLKTLDLNNVVGISADAIKTLGNFRNMTAIGLVECGLTDADVAELRRTLPETEVSIASI